MLVHKAHVVVVADVCKVLSLLHQKLSQCSSDAVKKPWAHCCRVLQ